MIKQKSGMGTTVRCPRCKFENVAIDIWCARCGTPVDWKGVSHTPVSKPNGNGATRSTGKGRSNPLAELAAALPWLRAKSATATPAASPAPAAQPAPLVAVPPPTPVVAVPPPTPVVAAAPRTQVVAAPPPTPVVAAAPAPEAPHAPALDDISAEVPVARPARVFCPGCGQANEAGNIFCPRCGKALAAAAPGPSATMPSRRLRTPRQFNFPRMQMPRIRLPRVEVPRLRLPRVPILVWAVAAAVVILMLAPLAYVLASPGRHLVSSRNQPATKVSKSGSTTSALSAAIPGVEAKTGLKYATGSCPSNSPCLRLAGQTNGLNAAAVQFSTAVSGGRQCVGYVYRDGATWHFLDATCQLPGQLSPLVGNPATVHVPGQCANVRDAASLSGNIVVCLNDGTTVHVDGGPNYAGGKIWWHLEKNGWMAHDFLVTA